MPKGSSTRATFRFEPVKASVSRLTSDLLTARELSRGRGTYWSRWILLLAWAFLECQPATPSGHPKPLFLDPKLDKGHRGRFFDLFSVLDRAETGCP
jgi:hypothetical protein